jgi:Domain of unknown function (DUF4062)
MSSHRPTRPRHRQTSFPLASPAKLARVWEWPEPTRRPRTMPRSLTQYRVFIGSPGGLEDERRGFRDTLERFNRHHGKPAAIVFDPVGWEDTIGGVGRPQDLINDDLSQCDYAVFVLHDRWGTPTGTGHSSGFEAEWELAEKLHSEKIRNIALFFKDASGRPDPAQFAKVVEFHASIEREKKYFSKPFANTKEFCDRLEGYLPNWARSDWYGMGGVSSGLALVSAFVATTD